MYIWSIYTRFCIYIFLIYQSKFISCNDSSKPPPNGRARTSRSSGSTLRSEARSSDASRLSETESLDSRQSVARGPRLVVIDVQKKEATKYVNYSFDCVNKAHVFTCKDSSVIKEVMNGTTLLWKAKGSDYGTTATLTPDRAGKLKLAVYVPDEQPESAPSLRSSDQSSTESRSLSTEYDSDSDSEETDGSVSVASVTRRRPRPPKTRSQVRGQARSQSEKEQVSQQSQQKSQPSQSYLSIITRDEFDDKKLAVDDITKYDLCQRGDIMDFTFREAGYCVEVKLGNESMWKWTSGFFPKSISFDKRQNRLVVRFDKYYIVCQKNQGTWETARREYAESQIGKEPSSGQIQRPESKPSDKKPAQGVKVVPTERPVVLDVNKKSSSNEFDYSQKNSKYGVYIPKHNFIFKVIRVGSTLVPRRREIDIWHPKDETEYVKRVMIDGVGTLGVVNNVTLSLVNGDFKHFSYIRDNWDEISPSIILDLSKTQNTLEFELKHDRNNNTRTYTPKGEFLFKGIKKTNGLMRSVKCVDIWDAKDFDEYAQRVVLKGDHDTERYLVIFQINGEVKLYYKSSKENPWMEELINDKVAVDLYQSGVSFEGYEHCIPADVLFQPPAIKRPVLHTPPGAAPYTKDGPVQPPCQPPQRQPHDQYESYRLPEGYGPPRHPDYQVREHYAPDPASHSSYEHSDHGSHHSYRSGPQHARQVRQPPSQHTGRGPRSHSGYSQQPRGHEQYGPDGDGPYHIVHGEYVSDGYSSGPHRRQEYGPRPPTGGYDPGYPATPSRGLRTRSHTSSRGQGYVSDSPVGKSLDHISLDGYYDDGHASDRGVYPDDVRSTDRVLYTDTGRSRGRVVYTDRPRSRVHDTVVYSDSGHSSDHVVYTDSGRSSDRVVYKDEGPRRRNDTVVYTDSGSSSDRVVYTGSPRSAERVVYTDSAPSSDKVVFTDDDYDMSTYSVSPGSEYVHSDAESQYEVRYSDDVVDSGSISPDIVVDDPHQVSDEVVISDDGSAPAVEFEEFVVDSDSDSDESFVVQYGHESPGNPTPTQPAVRQAPRPRSGVRVKRV